MSLKDLAHADFTDHDGERFLVSRDGRFIVPRRFSEVWQMSEDLPGTLLQQVRVRRALEVVYESVQWKLLKLLDTDVNKWAPVGSGGITYIPIFFVNTDPYLGRAFNNALQLDDGLHPDFLHNTVWHELWHIYDGRIMTWEDRTWFMEKHSPDTEFGPGDRDWRHFNEFFADEGRNAWTDDNHYLWTRLIP